MRRSGKPATDVTVVRTGPDTRTLRRGPASPTIRRGAVHLLRTIGVMGPQDGVDTVLSVADDVDPLAVSDIAFTLIGSVIASRS